MSETPIQYPEIHGHIVRIICGPAVAPRVRELLPEVEVEERPDVVGDGWWAVSSTGSKFEGAGTDDFEPGERTRGPEAHREHELARGQARAEWEVVAPSVRLPAPPTDDSEPTS